MSGSVVLKIVVESSFLHLGTINKTIRSLIKEFQEIGDKRRRHGHGGTRVVPSRLEESQRRFQIPFLQAVREASCC